MLRPICFPWFLFLLRILIIRLLFVFSALFFSIFLYFVYMLFTWTFNGRLKGIINYSFVAVHENLTTQRKNFCKFWNKVPTPFIAVRTLNALQNIIRWWMGKMENLIDRGNVGKTFSNLNRKKEAAQISPISFRRIFPHLSRKMHVYAFSGVL